MAQPIDPYIIVTVTYCESGVGIEELSNMDAELIKITDLMGGEAVFTPNVPMLYIYSDGSVRKKVVNE